MMIYDLLMKDYYDGGDGGDSLEIKHLEYYKRA